MTKLKKDLNKFKKKGKKYSGNGGKSSENGKPIRCKYCLKMHLYGKSHCPAAEKKCNDCGKEGHFKGSESAVTVAMMDPL